MRRVSWMRGIGCTIITIIIIIIIATRPRNQSARTNLLKMNFQSVNLRRRGCWPRMDQPGGRVQRVAGFQGNEGVEAQGAWIDVEEIKTTMSASFTKACCWTLYFSSIPALQVGKNIFFLIFSITPTPAHLLSHPLYSTLPKYNLPPLSPLFPFCINHHSLTLQSLYCSLLLTLLPTLFPPPPPLIDLYPTPSMFSP